MLNACLSYTRAKGVMSSITFDTHKFVRKLQEAGFDEKQAEGLTDAMRAAIDESELVTKNEQNRVRLD